MTTPTNPSDPSTPFLPTTYNVPEEKDRIDLFLQDNFAGFSDVINDKKIGTYVQGKESFSGEKWWYKNTKVTRNGYQAMAYIASFPNVGVLTLDLTNSDENFRFPISGIDPEFVIIQVYGSASKPCSSIGANDGDYFSFYSEGNSKIKFTMSDTMIVITTTADMTDYSGFIVIQYLRNGV